MLGTGTALDPFVITTAQELQDINLNRAASYILINDIDLAGRDWTPIAQLATEPFFTGSFDGQGHTISNMNITDPNNLGRAGFFGITNGYIGNFKLVNARIAASGTATGLAVSSLLFESVAENIEVEGIITLKAGRVANYAGGFMGVFGNNATVRNCSAKGSVSATEIVGGFAGQLNGAKDITNCFSDCVVESSVITKTANGSFYCYKASTHKGKVTNCYYNSSKYIKANNDVATKPLTTAQMAQQASFVGFDFVNTWYMGTESPKLRIFNESLKPALKGTVTVSSGVAELKTIVELHKKKHSYIQSYTVPLLSHLESRRATLRRSGSFILPVNSNVTSSAKKVHSIIARVESHLKAINSTAARKAKTVKSAQSYVKPISSNTSVSYFVPLSDEVVNAYLSWIENPTGVYFSDNLTSLNYIENPTTLEVEE